MKKYWDIILINLLFLIFALLIYNFIGHKVEVLGAFIAIGISLSLGIRSYKSDNDKIFKELFKEFNEKYANKFNDGLEDIENQYMKDNNFVLDADKRKLVVDYLNRCAEEYLWYELERIPEKVWRSWENGMVYYLNIKPINIIVQEENKKSDSYYGLFKKIEQKLNSFTPN